MKIDFSEEQLKLISKLDISFDASSDLSDDEILEIDEKVSDYFALHCVDKGDNVNDEGLVCESIIDIISEL